MSSYDSIVEDASGVSGETFDYPRPLFVYADKIDDEDTILSWAKKARDAAVHAAKRRNENLSTNNAIYKGEDRKMGAQSGGTFSHLTEVPQISSAAPQTQYVIVNHMHDLTETRVARFSRYRDNLEVLPAQSSESSDKQSARLVKELIKYLRYVTDFKSILATMGRRMILGAEAYMFVEWDPEKGNIIPEVESSLKETGQPPSLEPATQSTADYSAIQGENTVLPPAKPLSEEQWHMGEVSFRVPYTCNIFLDPVVDGDYSKCEWVLERELLHVDVAKKRFPEKAADICEDSFSEADSRTIADMRDEEWDGKTPKGFVWCWYLWHKKNRWLPEGRLIIFTNATLLRNIPHPYTHKGFPCVRLIDMPTDGKLYPTSVFSMARGLNGLLNNMYSMIYRYMVLGAPKWMVHDLAAVEPIALGNDFVALKWRGQIPPKIEAAPPMAGELFAFIAQMKEELRTLMVVFPMAQGNVPPNIRAGVSMLFMDEQENERFDEESKKHNVLVVDAWKLAMEVVRQYYPQDSARKMAVFGTDESYVMKDFDPTLLNTPMEIRLQNAPSLPESKAARTQYLLDIDERKPLPPDQFYEYLDLGIPEAYTNEITKAKRAADFENEEFFKGGELQDPQSWEDGIAHLMRHYIVLQDKAFRKMQDDRQQAFLKHVGMTEAFLMEKTFVDFDMSRPVHPGKAELLAQMPMFPAVFVTNTSRAELMGQVQDGQLEQAVSQVSMPGGGLTMGMEGEQPIAEAGPQATPMTNNPESSPLDTAQSEPVNSPESTRG